MLTGLCVLYAFSKLVMTFPATRIEHDPQDASFRLLYAHGHEHRREWASHGPLHRLDQTVIDVRRRYERHSVGFSLTSFALDRF